MRASSRASTSRRAGRAAASRPWLVAAFVRAVRDAPADATMSDVGASSALALIGSLWSAKRRRLEGQPGAGCSSRARRAAGRAHGCELVTGYLTIDGDSGARHSSPGTSAGSSVFFADLQRGHNRRTDVATKPARCVRTPSPLPPNHAGCAVFAVRPARAGRARRARGSRSTSRPRNAESRRCDAVAALLRGDLRGAAECVEDFRVIFFSAD